MDITRNWRLKNTRSQLLATRRPDGAIVLPHNGGKTTQQQDIFEFSTSAPRSEGEAEFSRAAR